MTQTELDTRVARVTGESLRRIRRMGFSLANPRQICFDPEPDMLPPQCVEWDELDAAEPPRIRRRRTPKRVAA
jgi:hypothetical protein